MLTISCLYCCRLRHSEPQQEIPPLEGNLQQDRSAFPTYPHALEEFLFLAKGLTFLSCIRGCTPSDAVVDTLADFLYSTGALVRDE